jgi:hypothetical protein
LGAVRLAWHRALQVVLEFWIPSQVDTSRAAAAAAQISTRVLAVRVVLGDRAAVARAVRIQALPPQPLSPGKLIRVVVAEGIRGIQMEMRSSRGDMVDRAL